MTEGRSLSYRNQSIDLHNKSIDWVLYVSDLRHKRVKKHFYQKIRNQELKQVSYCEQKFCINSLNAKAAII